jgi:hypothetical protein
MGNNVLCYVQRSLITKWKRLVLTRDEPLFVYGSNDHRVFEKRLRNGGVLWVIASIPKGPPQLVARLDIEMVRKREDPELNINPRFLQEFNYTWIGKGKETSEFFGHNNAECPLLQLTFLPEKRKPWKIDEHAMQWQGKYGRKLRSPRYICERDKWVNGLKSVGSQPLIDLKKKKARTIFLSWKWRDNKKSFMRELANELVVEGFMPWLDLLAMPWSRDLKEREKDKPKLARLLKYGYQRSALIVAIDSTHYGTANQCNPNWTANEWNGKLATDKMTQKIVYRPEGHHPSELIKKSDDQLPVFHQPPREFAVLLRDWFDNHMACPEIE